MLRFFHQLGGLMFAAACAAANAPQAWSQDSGVSPCPRGAVSVYYARGETAPSEEAMLLIARISEEAVRCQPLGIDLVTEIDSKREGDGAIALAMARLNTVADSLVLKGYPADRLRLAAQATPGRESPPMGGITIYFHQSSAMAGEASAPASSSEGKARGDEI